MVNPEGHSPKYWHRHPDVENPMPKNTLKCNYPDDAEHRRRSETVAMVTSIVFALVPLGLSVPVAYKWPLFGISAISALYMVITIVPSLRSLERIQQLAICICVLSLAFALFWGLIKSQYNTEKSLAVEGDLHPRVKSLTPIVPIIAVGGTTYVFHNSNSGDMTQVIKVLFDAGLRVEVEDGELKVTTPVRDRFGHLVAWIKKNHWYVTFACLDKNYTTDSLEVLDSRGYVVLQIKILPDRVEVQGEWRDEFGNGIRLAAQPTGSTADIWHTPEVEQSTMQKIKPMFKYPSSNHWSESD
jgi:hypothetical protein